MGERNNREAGRRGGFFLGVTGGVWLQVATVATGIPTPGERDFVRSAEQYRRPHSHPPRLPLSIHRIRLPHRAAASGRWRLGPFADCNVQPRPRFYREIGRSGALRGQIWGCATARGLAAWAQGLGSPLRGTGAANKKFSLARLPISRTPCETLRDSAHAAEPARDPKRFVARATMWPAEGTKGSASIKAEMRPMVSRLPIFSSLECSPAGEAGEPERDGGRAASRPLSLAPQLQVRPARSQGGGGDVLDFVAPAVGCSL
jgi:hypothetical protein